MSFRLAKPIYFDNNATTRPFDEVVEAVSQCMRHYVINPASPVASFWNEGSPGVTAARAMVRLLGAEEPSCFAFTSGATEANNWAVATLGNRGRRGKVLVSEMEHPSVVEPLASFQQAGGQVVEVPTTREGIVDLSALERLIDSDVVGISIQSANNVTGVIQPIAAIGGIIRSRVPKALFHTDATQAVGKLRVDLTGDFQEVDLLSFSTHKFHGPRGVGGIYIRPGTPIAPFLLGGGQERGLRSGTENSPGLAGLARAAEIIFGADWTSVEANRSSFERGLRDLIPGVVIHGDRAPRLPNTSCIAIPMLDCGHLVQWLAMQNIIIGLGAACSAGSLAPAISLRSMGVDYALAQSSFRISASIQTTKADYDTLLQFLLEYVSTIGVAGGS